MRQVAQLCIVAGTFAVFVGCDAGAGGRGASIGEAPLAGTTLVVAIGEDEGEGPEYLFGSIRTVLVAPSGRVWVIDASSSTPTGQNALVRLYDSTGVFLRTVGGEGEGPGEYRAPYDLAALSDGRVALRDARLRDRISIYAHDGAIDTTWTLRGDLQWPLNGMHGLEVDTGGVVWLPFRRSGRPGASGGQAGSEGFLRLWPDGTVADTVPFPEVPDVPNRIIRLTKVLSGGGTSVVGLAIPFRPSAIWSWSPVGGFVVARTDRYELTLRIVPRPLRDETGFSGTRPTITFARDVPPILVSEEERDAAFHELLAKVQAAGGGRSDIPDLPEFWPPITSISFSDDSRLLVRVSSPSSEVDGKWSGEPLMDVFERDGTFRARVQLPDSFVPLQMTGDQIWGVYRNALNVESIRRYDVIWP